MTLIKLEDTRNYRRYGDCEEYFARGGAVSIVSMARRRALGGEREVKEDFSRPGVSSGK